MNRGLLAKAFRESRLVTLGFGGGLAVAEAVLAFSLMGFQDQISAIWSQLTFLQKIFQAFLGASMGERLGPEMLGGIAWVHPVVFALGCAHAIALCTRVPAGEVDRGTIDLLLGLPVSRWQIYSAESLVWLGSGVAALALGAAGNAAGTLAALGSLPPDFARVGIVLVNLFCLYLAVGGLTLFASALSNRRGRAIGAAFAFAVGMYLLNHLAQFWNVAERLSFLSVLHYYRPLPILRDGVWPIGDLIVLLATGGALWLAGGVVFSRRDLSSL